jgi:hypothetical protein
MDPSGSSATRRDLQTTRGRGAAAAEDHDGTRHKNTQKVSLEPASTANPPITVLAGQTGQCRYMAGAGRKEPRWIRVYLAGSSLGVAFERLVDPSHDDVLAGSSVLVAGDHSGRHGGGPIHRVVAG